MMTLAQAQLWLQQEGLAPTLVGAGSSVAPQLAIDRVHTDSRSVQPGDLFVALSGARFDAHDFLPQARQQGAAAAIVARGRSLPDWPGIEVDDPLQALAALARQWRRQFSVPVMAVTGSNGKTTVTHMLASILRAAFDDQALATEGNFNNEIGVPLMVLRLRAEHRSAVFELGMNHPGEIARLAAIAQPTVALVNNAQREHQEFMQSVAAVARENGAVLQALPDSGTAVFPEDDAYAATWRQLAGDRPVVTFGARSAAVHIRRAVLNHGVWEVDLGVAGEVVPVNLHVLGRHNLRNAMAAAATALAAGLPVSAIAQGLEAFRPVPGRGVVHQLLHDDGTRQVLIDDTYNANPDSVRAAIDVLAQLPAPRLLVLGDMGEVGADGPAMHAEVGEYARAMGVDGLWTLGAQARLAAQAFGAGARSFEDMEALIAELVRVHVAMASMLVKGSRFMRMERAVQAVLQVDGTHTGRAIA
ncbi:UDP-N-acetylmuramoylalanyl-D-glutamyl-2, 6-diaminopimelate--D-alanyl-D-alanine ligase [Lampropedia cohaerens]|uniref:UDP-N-acetylmuramoyl-tripeptide--D-alanyl-D-alanine ligase n=1 Tax=Lampropedia cohaerens TaxID=1610491 RepID=A0A0U1PZ91_9BURK|nr:UDP-N-acetylmuramoylalanyl-D-glutamyl-2, 6-diaminopimelate--D-alanyl-D-alanine ligase [Lampropedia cohaerens]